MKASRTITMGVVSLFGLIVLHQQCYAGVNILAEADAGGIDWMSEIKKGGMTGYALMILAVIGVLFIIERSINLRRANIISSPEVVKQVAALGHEHDYKEMNAIYQKNASSFTKVANYMAENEDNETSDVMVSAADMASREIESHRRRNYGLGVVATLAPLLGLLGTMIGMIEAFAKFSKLTDSSEAALVLGDSIGKALITTAVGLIIAIAALSAFHFFKVKLGGFSDQLEADLDLVQHKWFKK